MIDVVKFQLGEKVRHLMDEEKRGIVTGIIFRPHGTIYLVTWGFDLQERGQYEAELTIETVTTT